MSSPLAKFSEDALIEELARRRNAAAKAKKPRAWCEACAHFKYASERSSDSYNCCTKGHAMEFRMPLDGCNPSASEWGFFRRVCPDRAPIEPAPPTPADAKLRAYRAAPPARGTAPTLVRE